MATITITIGSESAAASDVQGVAYCLTRDRASCVFVAKEAEARIDAALEGPLAQVGRANKFEGLNAVAGPERKIDAQGVDTFIQAASAYAQAERKAAASMSTGNQILYQMGLVAPVVDFPAIVRKMAKPNG